MGTGSHHIVPFKTYLNILLALLILTVITVAAAQFDFGFLNTFVALLIASVKAALVLAVFMHLKYDKKLNLVIILTGVFFVIVFWAFSYVDIISRNPVTSTL